MIDNNERIIWMSSDGSWGGCESGEIGVFDESMIDKTENIIWASCADGSWGGCERGDLIIVRESDLTDDEREAIADDASTIDDIYDVLSAAEERKARLEA